MHVLIDEFPKGTGLMLAAFDFNEEGEQGHMSYASNGRRTDMIKALRELADRLECDPRLQSTGREPS